MFATERLSAGIVDFPTLSPVRRASRKKRYMRVPLNRTLCATLFLAMAATAQAQFVAYFDHARGTNANGVGTHQYTLSYLANVSGSSGFFTNISDGVTTPVVLISTTNGAGAAISTGTSAGVPAAGTPAYATFNGFVYFGTTNASAIQVPSNSFQVYTFSNLNPNARYNLKGTAIRGNAPYTNRWTKVTIAGADSATPNHTANVLTTTQAPADLGPNDAAFNSGVNHLSSQGDMVGWDDILSGADGVFQIISTRYTGFVPNGGTSRDVTGVTSPYGYAISGIRLEEIPGAPEPIMITAGPTPASLTIDQGQTAQFQVTVTGTAPRYEWYREDGQAIQNAVSTNTSVLVLTNAQPTDTAIYHVRVTNLISSQVSGPAALTVNEDTTPPIIIATLGLSNGTNILISASERLDTAAPLDPGFFHVALSAGGGDLTIVRAVVTNGTNILITTSPRTANVDYSLIIDPSAFADINGNSTIGANIPFPVELILLSFDGTAWKYENSGIDMGDDWRNVPEFDDSAWADGISVFDVKRGTTPRATIAGFTVRTVLMLTNNASTNNIPTTYFRTHFTLPTDPDQVTRLRLRTLADDADVTYLNNGPELRRSTRYTGTPDIFEYCTGNISDATIEGPFTLPTTSLVAGENLIAASLHQDGATSSDSTFAYELTATINRFQTGPRLTITYNGANIQITWTNPSDKLYSATSANAPPGSWTLVGTGGSATVATSGVAKFFTLRQ
jgi:hypothetical protein